MRRQWLAELVSEAATYVILTLWFFFPLQVCGFVATMGILVEGVTTEYRQREEHGKGRERESERVSLAQDTGRTGRERG